jgi:translation initiation factor 1A
MFNIIIIIMPKKKKGGKKGRRGKNVATGEKTLDLKANEIGTEYGVINKLTGHRRALVKILTMNDNAPPKMKVLLGTEIYGRMRKGMKRKKQFCNLGTIVIIGIRDFQLDKADIVYAYKDQDDVSALVNRGEIPEEYGHIGKNEEKEDDGIDFIRDNIMTKEERDIQYLLSKVCELQEYYDLNNVGKTVNEEEVKDALQFNSYRSLFDIGHLIKKPSYSKPDKVVDKIVDNDGNEFDFDDI